MYHCCWLNAKSNVMPLHVNNVYNFLTARNNIWYFTLKDLILIDFGVKGPMVSDKAFY